MNASRARQRFIAISDPSGVGEARREMAALGASAGLDPERVGDLALAVTEAASNIAKHTREGLMVGRVLERGGRSGIEVIAIDKGAGMANVAASMQDGHSTSGTPGQGLGALSRITSAMDIWSYTSRGTLLRFEIWPDAATAPHGAALLGVLCKEKPGETACGDGWTVVESTTRLVAFVVDGLGHGPEAAAAAQIAIMTVEKYRQLAANEMMEAVHAALRATRGAAGAVAVIDAHAGRCDYCGVGNISAVIRFAGKRHSLVSNNGTLGQHIRKLQSYQYAFMPGALFIAHSDGIATHWDLAAYPGIEARHPALIAASLFRDHSRGRDDATVLALRGASQAHA
jgi:anti-sigma regulatory factor (Ser/Thr protein kinase)